MDWKEIWILILEACKRVTEKLGKSLSLCYSRFSFYSTEQELDASFTCGPAKEYGCLLRGWKLCLSLRDSTEIYKRLDNLTTREVATCMALSPPWAAAKHPVIRLHFSTALCCPALPPPCQCSGQRGLVSLVTALRWNCGKQVELDSPRQNINSSSPSDNPPPGFGLHQEKWTIEWIVITLTGFLRSFFLACFFFMKVPTLLYDPCSLAHCYAFIRLLFFTI